MESTRVLILLVATVICSLTITCYAKDGITLASLDKSIEVTASPKEGQVLDAGVDEIKVTWMLNQSSKAGTADYKTVKLKLCFAPISQKDRPWRKSEEHNLAKDKTCQFNIVTEPYSASTSNTTWKVERDVPTGTYFVRAYVYNAEDHEVAYGQSTNTAKTVNLFQIKAITGRHASLDIASAVFSAFSIVSLFFFFWIEKRKAKKVSQSS